MMTVDRPAEEARPYEQHAEACRNLELVGYAIKSLATAFRRTGNATVADELDELASEITAAVADLEAAFDREFRGSLGTAKQAAANILQAALAGVLKSRKDPDA